MAGTEGNDEMNVLKALLTSLAQSVQTLTARQAAPTEQLKQGIVKKQGIVRQQNLLDEQQTKAKAIAASVVTAPAVILDDPSADLSKPVTVKRGLLADTDEGKAILLALGSADKLLASRLLNMSVVCAASSNAIG